MRLLLTADTVGGVWTFALELARALGPHDVQIALAAMGGPLSAEQRAQARDLAHVEVYESRHKLEWTDDPWLDVERAGDWLLDLEHQTRPDLVHLNGTFTHGALRWRAPTLVTGHSCVLSWWRAVKGEDAPAPAWNRYKQNVARGLRAAGLVAAPTQAMLDCLQAHYGPLPRTVVLPNGRAPALFAPRHPKQQFVAAAGRVWDEAKNIAALARVAPDLPWPVYVAGEGTRPGSGEAGSLSCESIVNQLRPLGRLDQERLADLLARAAVYALPARYEPFGLSVLEAGLAGCALVLGDIPSLREVWDDAAWFVHPDDTDGLRDALQYLITHPDERDALAKRARARALTFSPRRLVDGHLAAYHRLLTRAKTASTPAAFSPGLTTCP